MRSIRPRLVCEQVTVAEDQEEFKTITAALVRHPGYGVPPGKEHNTHLLAFKPDADELARLSLGEPLYLSLLTYGGRMPGVMLIVGEAQVAQLYDVPIEGG